MLPFFLLKRIISNGRQEFLRSLVRRHCSILFSFMLGKYSVFGEEKNRGSLVHLSFGVFEIRITMCTQSMAPKIGPEG